MSNLAKTLKEIRQRSAHAPRGRLVTPDQLESLRASPDDVRTLLSVVDHVLELCAEIRYGNDRGLESLEVRDILWAMEEAVRPDLVLTEQQE